MAYQKQPLRVMRFNLDPVYDNATGNAIAGNATAHVQAKLVQNEADPNDQAGEPWKPVPFNLLDPAIKDLPITAAGKTVTYQELAQLIRKASIDRANAAGIV